MGNDREIPSSIPISKSYPLSLSWSSWTLPICFTHTPMNNDVHSSLTLTLFGVIEDVEPFDEGVADGLSCCLAGFTDCFLGDSFLIADEEIGSWGRGSIRRGNERKREREREISSSIPISKCHSLFLSWSSMPNISHTNLVAGRGRGTI